MKKTIRHSMSVFIALSFPLGILANTRADIHLPISHCYHWINEGTNKYLTYKYKWAEQHDGEVTFYTNPATSNGAVAGPGLYCGKSPGDSYSYGDRLIRVDFVDDVVMFDSLTNTQYCGHKGNFYQSSVECQSKPWDIKFYSGGGKGNTAWYVIRNPQAIAFWSATSDQLIADLNAEKAFESSSYAIHADNTIRYMKPEALLKGFSIVHNQNARLSIIKILKDPAKLAQIPPLTVIALVKSYVGPDLNEAAKKKIYPTQIERAFKDTKLTFSDFLSAIKLDASIEAAFVAELKKVDLAKLDNLNPIVILQSLDKYESQIPLAQGKVKDLWRSALLSTSDLQSLVDTNLNPTGQIAIGLEDSLPTKAELQKDLAKNNLIPLIKLLNTYVANGTDANLKIVFKSLIKDLFISQGPSFAKTFDKITNAKLSKETTLLDFLNAEYFSDMTAKPFDPLVLGSALDRVEKLLDADTLAAIQADILKAKFTANPLPAHQILSDFQDKKITLPSFYTEKTFLGRIIDRSIEERSTVKTPTNTFRLITSGLYMYFNSLVKKEKDGADKDAASLKASNALISLVDTFTTPEKAPYRYITLQNAGHFEGKGRYKDHPIESFFVKYQTGDASFDAFFENVITKSYDGSVVQYLLFLGDKNKPAVDLLKMISDHLLSDSFKQEVKKPTFLASQKEKNSWANIINNRHYSPTDTTRVPSTICHVSSVFNKYHEQTERSLGKAVAKDMRDWSQDVYKNLCKPDKK